MKNPFITIIICILNYSIGFGQVFYNEQEIVRFETRINIQNFTGSLLTYPFESLAKHEIGVLIGEIKLMPEEQDSVYICNSISESIDNTFINILKIALVNYRAELELISEDSLITFYAIYKIENNEFDITYNNIPERLIGPMQLTMSNKIQNSNPKIPDEIIEIKQDLYYIEKIEEYQIKIDKLESITQDKSSIKRKRNLKLITKNEKHIIDNLDELIRRNPFNPELLEQRSEIYQKHGDLIRAKKDMLFIMKYLTNLGDQ